MLKEFIIKHTCKREKCTIPNHAEKLIDGYHRTRPRVIATDHAGNTYDVSAYQLTRATQDADHERMREDAVREAQWRALPPEVRARITVERAKAENARILAEQKHLAEINEYLAR